MLKIANNCFEKLVWMSKNIELSFIVINISPITSLSQKISQHIKKIMLMT